MKVAGTSQSYSQRSMLQTRPLSMVLKYSKMLPVLLLHTHLTTSAPLYMD